MNIPEPPTEKIKIEEQEIEPVDNFTYLGSVISPTNGAEKDIKSRLSKAKGLLPLQWGHGMVR